MTRPPKKSGKHRRGRNAATRGAVTLATLGLTTCTAGCGGVVDPLPPPALDCAQASKGQNLVASSKALQDSTLTLTLYSEWTTFVDPVLVANVTGATLDSLEIDGSHANLTFTLDSVATTSVTFTLSGRFALDAGPCGFSRTFTVTIDNGAITVAVRERELPLGLDRDLRIHIVERDGLCVHLRAHGVGNGVAAWRVTGGSFETIEGPGIAWRLPEKAGFYQVELTVDRGNGLGFDALSVEVT
jgi:hypothetical protein